MPYYQILIDGNAVGTVHASNASHAVDAYTRRVQAAGGPVPGFVDTRRADDLERFHGYAELGLSRDAAQAVLNVACSHAVAGESWTAALSKAVDDIRNVSPGDVRALACEAHAAGDVALEQLCDQALNGIPADAAMAACLIVRDTIVQTRIRAALGQ